MRVPPPALSSRRAGAVTSARSSAVPPEGAARRCPGLERHLLGRAAPAVPAPPAPQPGAPGRCLREPPESLHERRLPPAEASEGHGELREALA